MFELYLNEAIEIHFNIVFQQGRVYWFPTVAVKNYHKLLKSWNMDWVLDDFSK